MKHVATFLGITACFLTPLSAQNTPGSERPATPRVVQGSAKSPARTQTNSRCIYYVTSVSATGSHIPVVIRRYRGEDVRMFGTSHGSNYSAGDIGLTGSLNVQGALNELDPAISSARH